MFEKEDNLKLQKITRKEDNIGNSENKTHVSATFTNTWLTPKPMVIQLIEYNLEISPADGKWV